MSERPKCDKCGNLMLRIAPDVDTWQCIHCSVHPSAPSPVGTQEEWKCPQCAWLNSPYCIRCIKCLRYRQDESEIIASLRTQLEEAMKDYDREHKWLNDAAEQAGSDLDSVASVIRKLQAELSQVRAENQKLKERE